MITPCISVCVMDQKTGLCKGCKRTIKEIANWSSMTEAQREKIMKEIKSR